MTARSEAPADRPWREDVQRRRRESHQRLAVSGWTRIAVTDPYRVWLLPGLQRDEHLRCGSILLPLFVDFANPAQVHREWRIPSSSVGESVMPGYVGAIFRSP